MSVSTISGNKVTDRQEHLGPKTNVDDIFDSIGVYGNYQIKQILVLMLFMLENAFHLVGSVYIGFRPEFQCHEINTTNYLDNQLSIHNLSNVSVEYKKCGIDIHVNDSGRQMEFSEKCLGGYQYNIPEDWSTVTQWNLVCDNAKKSEFAKTMIMFGQAAGAAIFSPLADRFGRKPCNIAARVLYFIIAMATVFCPGIEVFWLMRFLQGTFQGGCVMTVTTLIIEILPKAYRHRGEGLSAVAWSLGVLFTTMVGYLCRYLPWRIMQLILALLTVHSLIDWIFVDESLRWLLANGKTDQAVIIIRKAAKTNNKDFETVMKAATTRIEPEEKLEEKAQDINVKKYSVLTILKHKSLVSRSIILWFAWITSSLTYYGLMLTTSKLSGDRYLNSSLGALAEFPGIIVQQILINRIGRKKMLMVFHGTAGISMVFALLTTSYGGCCKWLLYVGTTFSFIGRGAISGSFSSVFLFTPELYPTNLRNAGLGLASTISRVGSMVSPFAMTLSDYVLWGPSAVFAVMNLIVTVLLIYLPETMGRKLPTTVEEMKAWYDGKRTCACLNSKDAYKLEG